MTLIFTDYVQHIQNILSLFFLSDLCPVLFIQGAFMYFPPGEKAAASQSFPTSLIPSSEFNPPPFSPLTSLLS
ncbi:hypothetical protein EXN66_Car008592 [Channa argus]|uniref:Uncharacterized protein n=1 Tax=Channa argus TaxID=215402 RepID=A0A6G1PSF2_CHAAH|nr:hypothetical protein EXN66_Car008592 [Channa argus]